MEEFGHLKIPLEDIKKATHDFSNTHVIGSGGFGQVYKGVLPRFGMVALKRLDCKGHHEFWKEIMMLSSYKHENIVSLLGFCDEGEEKILVYECASRGSLDRHLSSADLTWMQRLRICVGAARGLSYLHDVKGTEQRVLHRDIKTSNILLDENWNAKVSDMGLSKIGPANVVGTLGYCDPLYMETRILTEKSDVYSFGVLLFEVLCGRLCFEIRNGQTKYLVPVWKESYKQKLQEIIFHDMKQHMDPSSLGTFSDIAFKCLQRSREQRPTMRHVVEELELALKYQETFESLQLPKDYKEMLMTAPAPLNYKEMLLLKGILLNGGKKVKHEALMDDMVDMQPILESETYWEQKLPSDYEDIIKRSKDSVQWKTKKELYFILCKGFLISYGEEWFYLANNGKKCLMLPARAALEEDRWVWKLAPETRFEEVADCIFDTFGIYCKFSSKMLSPQTTYAAFLVYELPDDYKSVDPVQVVDEALDSDWKEVYNIFLRTPVIKQENQSKIKGLPKQRSDGWMEVQVHEFQTRPNIKMISACLKFSSNDMSLKGVIVQGLDFRPL